MSFRGRGGGRFGGGRRPFLPPVRDENGNIKKPDPPSLFPIIKELPTLPEVSKKDEELVSKRRKLDGFWKLSPYYIENPKDKTVGVAAEIERYSDRYKPNVKLNRAPLSSVLKLAAAYFPSEILTQGSKQGRGYKGISQWTSQPEAAVLYFNQICTSWSILKILKRRQNKEVRKLEIKKLMKRKKVKMKMPKRRRRRMKGKILEMMITTRTSGLMMMKIIWTWMMEEILMKLRTSKQLWMLCRHSDNFYSRSKSSEGVAF